MLIYTHIRCSTQKIYEDLFFNVLYRHGENDNHEKNIKEWRYVELFFLHLNNFYTHT